MRKREPLDKLGKLLETGDWVLRVECHEQVLDFTFSTSKPYKINSVSSDGWLNLCIPEKPEYESAVFNPNRFVKVPRVEHELTEVF